MDSATQTFVKFTLPNGKQWALESILIFAIWEKSDGLCSVELSGHVLVDVVGDYNTLVGGLFDVIDLTSPLPDKLPDDMTNVVKLRP